jgi:hypothetical protein
MSNPFQPGPHMSRVHSSLLFALALTFAACAGSSSVVEFNKDATTPFDIQADGALEAGTTDELTPPDTSVEEDTEAIDLLFTELPPAEDTMGPACDPGEGCFLDQCTENSDCQSGWCVEHLGEGVCTQQCQEECPQGWSCKPVGAGGPDLVYVCVSDYANLCKPCADTGDCASPGGAQDVCVSYGSEGSFCGGSCVEDTDCPWGFSCTSATTVDGIEIMQCSADAGVCPCSTKSVALALWTPCSMENDWGLCGGKRICTEAGLTDCDASEPAEETCNGIDDNCDGDVDEPTDVGGDYINLCDDDNECTEDVCDGETGCSHTDLNEGECKDGDSCTVGDHCESGICIGNPVLCDDDNDCTDDSCDGVGGCLFAPNQADCNDDDPCTVADECDGGQCIGVDIACDCQVDADCAGLEDGDLCNGTLLCDTSELPFQCRVDADTIISCAEPDGPESICLAAACDAATGACSVVPDNDGFACDSGSSCTVGDHCDGGECAAGVAVGCDDGNPCTADSCSEEEGCVNAPSDGECDDKNACTLGDSCADGECGWGALLNCDDENPCTTDTCDPGAGCTHKLNTAPCDDKDVCTTGDYCHLGSCISSGALTCDDQNPCTADSCDPDNGCQFTPIDVECDDLNPCTEGDHCLNGWCIFANFEDCDDGLVCNGQEICDPFEGCMEGLDPILDDGNACTFDFCDEELGGIAHTPIDDACDNDLWCDGIESCDVATGCVAGIPPQLDDGVACTVDLCDEDFDTVKHLPDNSLCVDQDLCNGTETCDNLLGCQAGLPLNCVDAFDCTTDSCIAESGCHYEAVDGTCDDGTSCTDDSCSLDSGCLFTPVANGTGCTINGIPGECQAGACIPDCQPDSQTFNGTGGPATLNLPICATSVIIESWGAQAGKKGGGQGGLGARMKCRVQGLAGKTLEIRVGMKGDDGVAQLEGGGGGGGAFVWVSGEDTPLAIAGGGGGGSYQGNGGQPGLTTNQGGPGGYSAVPAGQGGYTDNGGGGGTGGGGGGWISNGTGNSWSGGGQAKGGAGGTTKHPNGQGGYGGGGGSYHGGGGGGGYSGGSGGTYTVGGGGGGSYCAGDTMESASGANSGNGKIIISWE